MGPIRLVGHSRPRVGSLGSNSNVASTTATATAAAANNNGSINIKSNGSIIQMVRQRQRGMRRVGMPNTHLLDDRQFYSQLPMDGVVSCDIASDSHFRSFSPDGSLLLAFAPDLITLRAYEVISIAPNIASPATTIRQTSLATSTTDADATAFWKFFRFKYEVVVPRHHPSGELLCREFMLFPSNDRFVVLASTRASTVSVQQARRFPCSLDFIGQRCDVWFYTVEIETGQVMDMHSFCADNIRLQYHAGVSISGNRLAVVSLANQSIRIIDIMENGQMMQQREIGWHVHPDDEMLLAKANGMDMDDDDDDDDDEDEPYYRSSCGCNIGSAAAAAAGSVMGLLKRQRGPCIRCRNAATSAAATAAGDDEANVTEAHDDVSSANDETSSDSDSDSGNVPSLLLTKRRRLDTSSDNPPSSSVTASSNRALTRRPNIDFSSHNNRSQTQHPQPQQQQQQQQPVRPIESSSQLSGLKQRILSFLYRQATDDKSPKERQIALQEFYANYSRIDAMVLTRAQLTDDGNSLLLRFSCPSTLLQPCAIGSHSSAAAFGASTVATAMATLSTSMAQMADVNSPISLLVSYDIASTNVRKVFHNCCVQEARKMMFEKYDQLQVSVAGAGAQHPQYHQLASPCNDPFARESALAEFDVCRTDRNQGSQHSCRQLMNKLPLTQPPLTSPYLDPSLFVFPNSIASAVERPCNTPSGVYHFRPRSGGPNPFRLFIPAVPPPPLPLFENAQQPIQQQQQQQQQPQQPQSQPQPRPPVQFPRQAIQPTQPQQQQQQQQRQQQQPAPPSVFPRDSVRTAVQPQAPIQPLHQFTQVIPHPFLPLMLVCRYLLNGTAIVDIMYPKPAPII